MKALPEGKSLGWMQAPASWIDSHTVRFIGVVRVVIQDGEGFILIKKGKPLFHYFKHGTIELKGHTALDYFNSHPVIEFNLCKYTPDEFAWAMKLCNIEDHERVVPREPAVSGPVSREHSPPSRPSYLIPPVAKPARDTKNPGPGRGFTHRFPRFPKDRLFPDRYPGNTTRPHDPADPPVAKPARDKRIPDPVVVPPPVPTVEKRPAVSGPVSTGTQPAIPTSRSTGRKTCQGQKNPWTRSWFHHRFTRLRKERSYHNLLPVMIRR